MTRIVTSRPGTSSRRHRRATTSTPPVMDAVEARLLFSWGPTPVTYDIADSSKTSIDASVLSASDPADTNHDYEYLVASSKNEDTSDQNFIEVYRVHTSDGSVDTSWTPVFIHPSSADNTNNVFSGIRAVDVEIGGTGTAHRLVVLWTSGGLTGQGELGLTAIDTATATPIPLGTASSGAQMQRLDDGYSAWMRNSVPTSPYAAQHHFYVGNNNANPTDGVMDVQDDGKVVVVGHHQYYYPWLSGNNGAAVWRFGTDGNPDTSFGNNSGYFLDTRFGGFHTVDHVGSSLFLTTSTAGTGARSLVAKLTSSGALDSSFTSGPYTGYASPWPNTADGLTWSAGVIRRDVNDLLILVSPTNSGADVSRLDPADGSVDTSFATSGHYVATGVGNVAINPNNDYVAVGGNDSRNPGGHVWVYDASGSLAAEFPAVYYDSSTGNYYASLTNVDFLADGRVLFLGVNLAGSGTRELVYAHTATV